MDLRRQLAVVRQWAWLFVAGVLLAGGAAFLVSNGLPRVYEAQTTLIVGQGLTAVNPDYSQLLASQRLSQTYADVAATRPILQHVIDTLGLQATTDTLARTVKAVAPKDSTLVTITASDGDPARAAAIANAIAEQLMAASPTIQGGRESSSQSFIDQDLAATQQQIEQTQAEITRLSDLPSRTTEQDQDLDSLQSRLATLRASYATLLQYSSNSAANLLSVVEPAVAPTDPSSPRPLLNTLLAAMVGLLLAAGIAFLAEYLDDTLKTSDQVEEAVGLPTLGAILRMKGDAARKEMYRLVTLLYPRSPGAEAYRALRTNIEFTAVDTPLRSLMVTSSVPGEGKTTTAANIAIAFAQSGRRTLLIDADLRKPAVHRLFGLPNTHGLTSLLRSDDVALDSLTHATEQDDLRVLTTGPLPPNPAELLGSQRMRAVLDRLVGECDLVVLDTPPLQAVTDAAVLASAVDGTIFVVHAGHTRQGAVRRGRETLARVDARVLGVVLNRLGERAQSEYYYRDYGSYYGTEGHPGEASAARRAPALAVAPGERGRDAGR